MTQPGASLHSHSHIFTHVCWVLFCHMYFVRMLSLHPHYIYNISLNEGAYSSARWAFITETKTQGKGKGSPSMLSCRWEHSEESCHWTLVLLTLRYPWDRAHRGMFFPLPTLMLSVTQDGTVYGKQFTPFSSEAAAANMVNPWCTEETGAHPDEPLWSGRNNTGRLYSQEQDRHRAHKALLSGPAGRPL